MFVHRHYLFPRNEQFSEGIQAFSIKQFGRDDNWACRHTQRKWKLWTITWGISPDILQRDVFWPIEREKNISWIRHQYVRIFEAKWIEIRFQSIYDICSYHLLDLIYKCSQTAAKTNRLKKCVDWGRESTVSPQSPIVFSHVALFGAFPSVRSRSDGNKSIGLFFFVRSFKLYKNCNEINRV